MAIPFNIAVTALKLAASVFTFVKQSSDQKSVDDHGLIDALDALSKKIDTLPASHGQQLASALEWQQLEKLSSQAKALRLALEFGHETMLAAALVPVSEQVEYSRLRLAEGKFEWLGPWLAGESIRIEALRRLANNPRAFDVVQRETANFRMAILKLAGKRLVNSMDDPWFRICSFVEGRDEALLLDIAELDWTDAAPETPGLETAPAVSEPEEAPVARSVIAPAAWPFPTSARP
jgi:hypothetical protein